MEKKTEGAVSETHMERVENRLFRNEMVQLDGKLFLNCEFIDCQLTYRGVRCEWERTNFSNCTVVLDGPANNTVRVLQGLGFSIHAPKLPIEN